MNKKHIISILLLLLQLGLVIAREMWSFSNNANIFISTIHVIASLIIVLCIASQKK